MPSLGGPPDTIRSAGISDGDSVNPLSSSQNIVRAKAASMAIIRIPFRPKCSALLTDVIGLPCACNNRVIMINQYMQPLC